MMAIVFRSIKVLLVLDFIVMCIGVIRIGVQQTRSGTIEDVSVIRVVKTGIPRCRILRSRLIVGVSFIIASQIIVHLEKEIMKLKSNHE